DQVAACLIHLELAVGAESQLQLAESAPVAARLNDDAVRTVRVLNDDRLIEPCMAVPADDGVDVRKLSQLLIQLDAGVCHENNFVYTLCLNFGNFIPKRRHPVAIEVDGLYAF